VTPAPKGREAKHPMTSMVLSIQMAAHISGRKSLRPDRLHFLDDCLLHVQE